MLKSLKLRNFRKHTDREFNFTPGLNILRGVNEEGKSTIFESIGYAMLGSTALRESLDDVVTYDKPVGSLKVELVIEFDGVDYKVVRGKSGAEVTYGDQRVTGQTETRKFFENLLGCTADTFSQLALAGQGNVRGVLSKGPTATNGLVETLAQLGVVEDIIDKVQNQLPSGNTTAVSRQIEAIEPGEKPEAVALQDTSDIQAKLADHVLLFDLANDRLPSANKLSIAEATLKTAGNLARDRSKQLERNAKLEAEEKPAPCAYTQESIDAARQTIADEAMENLRRKAYATKFSTSEQVWEGDAVSFERRVAEVDLMLKEQTTVFLEAKLESESKAKQIITGTTCKVCKQELPDAEHIKACNAELQSRIYDLAIVMSEAQKAIREIEAERASLLAIQRVQQHNLTLIGSHWGIDSGKQVPGVMTWKGEPPVPAGPMPDVAAMDKALATYRTAQAKYEQVQAQLAEPLPEVPNVDEETALIAEAEATRKELATLTAEKAALESELRNIKHANELATLQYDNAVAQHTKLMEQKKTLQETLAEMTKHNELIKKLRGARPAIATKLWGTVLGAVSHYTTSIRGEASMITKDSEGFKINGRNVEGLSGSGQDALGLAIRISLAKVFLPGLPFILLDEAFAACDDGREVNGLGTLAAANFQQCILVTHSDLGDSLADNLIQL